MRLIPSAAPAARRWLEPLLLLAGAGIGIGSLFPAARIAGSLGLRPLVFAGGTAVVAALVIRLAALALDRRSAPIARRRVIAYAAIAGPLTFGPFGLVAIAVPHVGAGMQALLQTLVPALTVLLSTAIGYERLGLRRAIGLAIGVCGAVMIVLSRFTAFDAPSPAWLILSLSAPALLAAGNVVRSLRWPGDASPFQTAFPTLLAAAAVLFLLAPFVPAGTADPAPGSALAAGALILGQGVLTGLGYVCFFRLQRAGGPIYLSQVSHVNAAFGMALSVLLFGETVGWLALVGAGVILMGIIAAGRPAGR